MDALTLTRDQVHNIVDTLNIDGDDARTNYPGRGMYGAECLGFVVDRSQAVFVGAAIASELARDAGMYDFEEALDTALEIAARAQVDSMGLGSIVYFPGVTVEG